MNLSMPLPGDLAGRVLDLAPQSLLVTDARGIVRYANRQACALFGCRAEGLIGRSAAHWLPGCLGEDDATRSPQFGRTAARDSGGDQADTVVVRGDGTTVAVEIALYPIEDGDDIVIAAAISDSTDRDHLRAELLDARATADRTARAKSRFLATASHELRQPLQSLALLNGTLQQMSGEPGVRDALAQQERSIASMSRLVNALLDISKLESGAIKPEIEDFGVVALLDELRCEFAAPATLKGIELRIPPSDASVRSDPSLLSQLLRNLVSNAVKYTRQGLVELKCLHAQASVRIEVLDTGIGMPADQLGRIYDEFYQIRGKADGARDGYGLGLSIVRQVVRLLDLKLDVSSELGKGSTFSLQVPASAQYRRREAAGRRAPGAEPSVGGRPLHVLLVEDDEAVRSATQLLLRVAGYRVTVAGSVAEAAEQARQQEPFDLLVADYHLGTDATGLDAIAAARVLQGRAVKAVLVTGDTSSLVQGLDYDANTRLTTKPVHAGEFLALLAELHPCN